MTVNNKAEADALVLDLGIGKTLKKGSVQVVLQWDLNAGRSLDKTKDLTAFDLDLWATFGDYTVEAPTAFDCHVGITRKNCGGVRFNGDSSDKKIGKSSESITFDVIGAYNYLIFFNRWYQKLPL